MRSISLLALWLFVINLGVAFGAGIYEHRIVLPGWISMADTGGHWHPDAARQDDTGLRFWVFVSTMPLTLLTLASLFLAWRSAAPLRGWWLAAAGLALADRVFTFSYFIPKMVGLMATPDSPDAAAAAMRWVNLNYLRHAIVLAAWLAALHSLGLGYRHSQ